MKKNLFTSAIVVVIAIHGSFTALCQDRSAVNTQPALTESQYGNSSSINGQSSGDLYSYGALPHMGTLSSTTGVVTVPDMGNLVIFPNPGKGVFTVKGFVANMINGETSLMVTDMSGRVVHRADANVWNSNVDFQVSLGNNLASGMYVVILRTGSAVKVFNYKLEQ